jgi:hypothetical protein
MTLNYGNNFERMWSGVDPAELVAEWEKALTPFAPADVSQALDVMRTGYHAWPPTLPQFVALCSDARARRAQRVPRLDDTRKDPPAQAQAAHRLAAEWANRHKRRHPHAWAYAIMRRVAAGEHVCSYAIDCAREVIESGRGAVPCDAANDASARDDELTQANE